jgi:hypothetical protein
MAARRRGLEPGRPPQAQDALGPPLALLLRQPEAERLLDIGQLLLHPFRHYTTLSDLDRTRRSLGRSALLPLSLAVPPSPDATLERTAKKEITK